MKTIKEHLRGEAAKAGRGLSREEHLLCGFLRGTAYLAMERIIGESTRRPEKLYPTVAGWLDGWRKLGINVEAFPSKQAWEAWCAGARVKGTAEATQALSEENARRQKREAMHVMVDEKLSPGLAAAQALHAARRMQELHSAMELRWYETSNTVVIHRASDLEGLARELRQLGAAVAPFVDPDLGAAITAVAVLGAARRVFRDLPLL